MINIRGLVVCVEYDDLLRLTLQLNMRHMTECLVITSPTDRRTIEFASSIPSVKVFETDAFTRYGAKFNKGLAIEEGLNVLGRTGWILIWDADTVFPPEMKLPHLNERLLYGPTRVILPNPKDFDPEDPHKAWGYAKSTRDREFPGFFQLFNSASPFLQNQPFWYDPTFVHAGGGDSYFQNLWPRTDRVRLPFNALHLGPRDTNWYGRISQRTDHAEIQDHHQRARAIEKLQVFNGWRRGQGLAPVTSLADRVQIPGLISTYNWHRSTPASILESNRDKPTT